MALAAGVAEVGLPVLLIVGLGARYAALGLLIMTGVIQLTFPEGWANFHLYWASLALAILSSGPARSRSIASSDWRAPQLERERAAQAADAACARCAPTLGERRHVGVVERRRSFKDHGVDAVVETEEFAGAAVMRADSVARRASRAPGRRSSAGLGD